MDKKYTKQDLLKLLEYVSDDAVIKVEYRGIELDVTNGGFEDGDNGRTEKIILTARG